MSNIKHIEILNEVVALWNQWRENHPRLIPDLCEAVITFTDRSKNNLRKRYELIQTSKGLTSPLKILVIGYDPCYLSSGKPIKYILCGFGSYV